jgi:hypothetical protein
MINEAAMSRQDPSLCSRRELLGALASATLARRIALPPLAMMRMPLPREGTFPLGDVMLESGTVVRQAFVGYKTQAS